MSSSRRSPYGRRFGIALLVLAVIPLVTVLTVLMLRSPHQAQARADTSLPDQFLATRTTALFLIAIGERDYAKACRHMLDQRACRRDLQRRQVGLTSFGIVGAMASLGHAIVVAHADGIQGQFALVKRHGHWLIREFRLG